MDEFLKDHQQAPKRDFAASLYETLNAPEAAAPVRSRTRRWALGATAAGIAAASLFVASPSVRAVGQQFLDLFRVGRITAISVDQKQIKERALRLKNANLDLKQLVADKVETIHKSGPPQTAATAQEAGQIAGISVLSPKWLPDGMNAAGFRVNDRDAVRLTADVNLVNNMLDFLELPDARLPESFNGKTFTFDMPAKVVTSFSRGYETVTLTQAKSPEISLPSGVALDQFGYTFLRLIGKDIEEARTLATGTDWRSTFVVPVPAQAAEFKSVIVRGREALLITGKLPARSSRPEATSGKDKDAPIEVFGNRVRSPKGEDRLPMNTLFWIEDGKVFALNGPLSEDDILQIANSLQ